MQLKNRRIANFLYTYDAREYKINEKFNTNISVEFTSSWEYRLNLGENMTEKNVKETSENE